MKMPSVPNLIFHLSKRSLLAYKPKRSNPRRITVFLLYTKLETKPIAVGGDFLTNSNIKRPRQTRLKRNGIIGLIPKILLLKENLFLSSISFLHFFHLSCTGSSILTRLTWTTPMFLVWKKIWTWRATILLTPKWSTQLVVSFFNFPACMLFTNIPPTTFFLSWILAGVSSPSPSTSLKAQPNFKVSDLWLVSSNLHFILPLTTCWEIGTLLLNMLVVVVFFIGDKCLVFWLLAYFKLPRSKTFIMLVDLRVGDGCLSLTLLLPFLLVSSVFGLFLVFLANATLFSSQMKKFFLPESVSEETNLALRMIPSLSLLGSFGKTCFLNGRFGFLFF